MNFAILCFTCCAIIMLAFLKFLINRFKESRKETKRLYDIFLKSFHASDREKYLSEKYGRNFYVIMIFLVTIFFAMYFLATLYLITK